MCYHILNKLSILLTIHSAYTTSLYSLNHSLSQKLSYFTNLIEITHIELFIPSRYSQIHAHNMEDIYLLYINISQTMIKIVWIKL